MQERMGIINRPKFQQRYEGMGVKELKWRCYLMKRDGTFLPLQQKGKDKQLEMVKEHETV